MGNMGCCARENGSRKELVTIIPKSPRKFDRCVRGGEREGGKREKQRERAHERESARARDRETEKERARVCVSER